MYSYMFQCICIILTKSYPCADKVTKLLKLQHNKSSRLKWSRDRCCMIKIYSLPAYKKHQHRTVHIVYAATKQQLLRFINIRWILSYNNDHVNILSYCFYWVVILIILIFFNFSRHKVKTPWRWCGCIATWRSSYII